MAARNMQPCSYFILNYAACFNSKFILSSKVLLFISSVVNFKVIFFTLSCAIPTMVLGFRLTQLEYIYEFS